MSAMKPENTNENDLPSPSVVPNPVTEPPQPSPSSDKSTRKRAFTVASIIVVVVIVAASFWLLGRHSTKPVASSKKANVTAAKTTVPQPDQLPQQTVEGLQLDKTKNYGNKYADGKLPVGDGKYSTTGAQKGYIYTCSTYAQNLATDNGGAQVRGPWFTSNNTEYDINKKVAVSGKVNWQSVHSFDVSGTSLIVSSNDLPDHPTGVFPVASSDAAHQIDPNPNSIKSQTVSYTLALNPTYGAPQCMGGQSGIMTTGVKLFNGFDAGGRDAGAWEVQDSCSGHPQGDGEYHYHTLSSCITDTSVSTVIGYALDGFPITGPKVGANNILTTSDLDECHGIVSTINLHGKQTTTYHYVMTQDFPYSVSCFRSTPIQTNPGPGQGGSSQKTGTPPPRPGSSR